MESPRDADDLGSSRTRHIRHGHLGTLFGTRFPGPTAAAAAEAVDAAESAARATTGPIDDNTRAAYAAHQDASAAADAEDAEAALTAAIRAVEHVLVVIDATSALLEAALAAEQARLNAYADEQSPQSVIDTARDAFATSITEVLSDADAYAAFREPIQESCQ